jgi:diguanylate cyclase (GGDEF)-like protein/PAS domain S-box-containing protein
MKMKNAMACGRLKIHPVLWYLVFGGFAVLLTDFVLQMLADDLQNLVDLQRIKTPIFVAISAILFSILITLDQRIRQRAQDALQQSEERYALAARAANDGLWDWDLHVDQIYFSPRWKSMLGYKDAEISSSSDEWLSRIHREDIERVHREIKVHLEQSTPLFQSEHRIRHQDGTYRWVLSRGLAVRSEEGEACRMVGSQTDITERRLAEEQLLHNALYDGLTGLPNRVLFNDRLDYALERTKRRPDYLFAVLFLDLDRFKVVNDSLGHAVGDQLLIAVARRLQVCLRTVDTVARLGGDEFTILLEDIKSVADATHTAERILHRLNQPFRIAEQDVFISTSIGIALGRAPSRPGYEQAADLLRDADIAMYRAKVQGKARYVMFDDAMHAGALSLLRMEMDLRQAIKNHEFQVYYQPIVSVGSGTTLGFEALVRWDHPQHGFIAPAEFIPVAEETGLISAIDRIVLSAACGQMREWIDQFPNHPDLTVSVNLSGKHFSQPDLAEQVTCILQETELPAKHLKLEITESAIMEDAESAAVTLKKLRALGIHLSIDDFGTGYSSLSYLRRFPINTLKIDRSFIEGVGAEGEDAEIVQIIVALAHNLGMDVTAEGVETPEQLAKLLSFSCQQAQGYYFSKAVDGPAAAAILEQESQITPFAPLATVS